MLTDYLPFTLAACIVWLLCDSFGRYVEISGRPKLVINYVVLNTALNFVLDLLLVVVLEMGMRGAAIASLVAPLLAMVVFIPYVTKSPRPFAVDFSGDYVQLMAKCLRRGIPDAVAMLMLISNIYMMANRSRLSSLIEFEPSSCCLLSGLLPT